MYVAYIQYLSGGRVISVWSVYTVLIGGGGGGGGGV